LQQNCTVKVSNTKGLVKIWDCENGTIKKISSEQLNDGSLVELSFEPYQAYWLAFDPDKANSVKVEIKEEKWNDLTHLNGLWNVKIDTTHQPQPVLLEGKINTYKEIMSKQSLAYNSNESWSVIKKDPPKEIITSKGDYKGLDSWVSWGLDRFTGYVDYYNTFNYNGEGKEVEIDLGKVKHIAELWINDVNIGSKLWSPFVFNITKAIRKGSNTIKVKIGNLMINEMFLCIDKNPKLAESVDWDKPKLKDLESGMMGPVVIKVRN
jgi:hypothetical protein